MSKSGASSELFSLCEGFGRVQLNLHAGYWRPGRDLQRNIERVMDFSHQVVVAANHLSNKGSAKSVILQHRSDWQNVPLIPDPFFFRGYPHIEYLWDKSGGRGQDSINLTI